MSVKIAKIAEFMNEWAEESTAEEFDNVGLLVGDAERETDKILTALDAVPPVIEEAAEKGCGLIVAHHPLFRHGLKKINSETPEGRKIMRLLENKTALYAAHTNLDKADGGVNDTLCKILGLNFETIKDERGLNGLLRLATLSEPKTLGELAAELSGRLAEMPENAKRAEGARIFGDTGRKIRKIAVCSGCGMSLLAEVARLGADLFISGDVRYHDANTAFEYGFCILDLSHYATEAPIAGKIKEYLESRRDGAGLEFEVFVSEKQGDF